MENVNTDGGVEFALNELAPGNICPNIFSYLLFFSDSTHTFSVTIKPKLFGIYDSTRARIRYGTGAVEIEGLDPDYRTGYSTSLGKIRIYSTAEHIRMTSYFVKEWAIFALWCGLLTLVPFYNWWKVRSAAKKISAKRRQ